MKTPNDSRSVLAQVMLPSHANPLGSVHGGEIMKLMDACGGVAATRHASGNVATVKVDELVFYTPIQVGNLVTCEAVLVFVGRSSMEVKVTVKVEDLIKENDSHTALTAIFTYVALGPNGRSVEVPGLRTTTAQEEIDYEAGKERYEKRIKHN